MSLRPALLMMLTLAACSGGEEVGESDDPSKLSAELEARATEIEEKADAAAAEVEREAAADLQQLQAEAREADAADSETEPGASEDASETSGP